MYLLTFYEYSLDIYGTHIVESHQGLILLIHMRSAHPCECPTCLASEESFVGLPLEVPEFFEDLLGCEELFLYVLVVCVWTMFCPLFRIVE